MFPHTRARLTGPPVVFPDVLDRASERWWRAPPRVRMLASVLLAGLVLLIGVAHAASDPNGPPVLVWVASRDLLPGEQLTSADVERRSWPRELVPPGAATEPGGTVTAGLPVGAVVTDLHLGERGAASAVPSGRVAVAIPLEQLPTLRPGTWLDLVGPGDDGRGAVLARAATVIADDGVALWVAVDPDDAVSVSAAVATATIGAVVLPR